MLLKQVTNLCERNIKSFKRVITHVSCLNKINKFERQNKSFKRDIILFKQDK